MLAKYLTNNQKLLLSSGKEVIIEKVEIEKLDKPETTYNFEVEDFHTYYVTDSGILVHNKCKGPKYSEYYDTYQEAENRAYDFLGDGSYQYEDTNMRVSQDGLRVARFDLDLSKGHVQKLGQHINLETYPSKFGTSGKPIINIHVFWRN